MSRAAAILYALVSYAIFLLSFLFAVGFLGGGFGPKTVDDGLVGEPWLAIVADVALLTIFALQHSVMARPRFKAWWTRFVPKTVERSTFVLLASLALLLLFWQWRPLPATVWSVSEPVAASLLTGLYWVGWLVVLLSTFMISHFDLFGLKQAFQGLNATAQGKAAFTTPFLYKYVRHPIYLGFVIAFWATPTMTVGHLLFAAIATAYIFVGIQLEERDLVAFFGDRYIRYRRQAGMLLPPIRTHVRFRAGARAD
ncbi:methanethiol S-methyltransferase [Methylobacterium haplocladii]|uniref:methanethiol S-methyltransferase n=1 Tax=Methylobacterium haplocladii TaxID=1176176 RepID=A0A512IRQ8_9HYPH|nr:methanethiol S-methyltransferase [Methylobacterium haplocladii]GEP00392.1 membrane protein [Methylobacterium haplocladii]GJD82587.1 Methanethiol S-methyltransferase [Methylobacterium haplocladii]GLS58824.1 membrane protein [Methylobacterium haplocladii]